MTKLKCITWNFGEQTPEKISNLTRFLKEDTASRPIYFIGLQEIQKQDHEVIVKTLASNIPERYKIISFIKDNSSVTSFITTQKFCLLSIIVYPDEINIQNISWRSEKILANNNLTAFAINTKGYLFADFTIDGVEYTLVNIHLPFVNGEFTNVNFNSLFRYFQDRRNIIILGDFNTRSTIDDTCILKEQDVSACKAVEFVKKYKGNLEQLQGLLNMCLKTDVPAVCAPLKSKLLEKDFLRQYLSKTPTCGYQEGAISFLPSYKVTPNEGVYNLIKRLPGYADRVLIRGEYLSIVENTYRLLHDVKGNDHLPVVVDVQMKSSSGGARRKRKTTLNKQIKKKVVITKKRKINK